MQGGRRSYIPAHFAVTNDAWIQTKFDNKARAVNTAIQPLPRFKTKDHRREEDDWKTNRKEQMLLERGAPTSNLPRDRALPD